MIFDLFRRRDADAVIYTVYGEIVSQARRPVFYLAYGVPDTVEARFDMILLHIIILFKRLEAEPPAVMERAQKVLDLFFQDMDRSIREMGVGDLTVPKKMKKLGEAYAGRSAAYGPALGQGDTTALAGAIERNIFADAPHDTGPADLASYALAAYVGLKSAPATDLVEGRIPWPVPAHEAAA